MVTGRMIGVLAATLFILHGCSNPTDRVPQDTIDAAVDTPSVEPDISLPDRTPPKILELGLAPVGGNPLAAILTLRADEPVACALVMEEVGTGRSLFVSPNQAPAMDHFVPVLGMRGSQTYVFKVEVIDGAGNSTIDESLDWQTEALPGDLPLITLLESEVEDSSPHVTLVNLIRWGSDVLNEGLLLGVDDDGEVVWIYRAAETLVEARRTPAGTIIVAFGESDGIREIDMLGNVLNEWIPAELGLDGLHHAVAPGPGDSILSLAPELRWIEGYLQENGDTTGYAVVGDRVVELPRLGLPARSLSLLDILDPYHYNPGFFAPFWFLLYPDAPGGPKDWSHANAIQYDPDDNSYIVSLANQDLVVKMGRDEGELIWALGEAGDVALQYGGSWFSLPHGAEWLPGGRLLLYDDGVFKDERRSRVVEYTLTLSDDDSWSAVETWSWDGGSDPFYCMGPADVDALPNGNLLVLHGSLVEHPEQSPFGGGNELWVRMEEIRREPAGERVFGVDIGGPQDPSVEKLTSFAVERLSNLYPESWEVRMEIPPPVDPCVAACNGRDCGWIDGCVCGVCFPGLVCRSGNCMSCSEICDDKGRQCGQIALDCSCGDCLDGFECDAAGDCIDEEVFCAPFCEGRECGIVGAFYLGQFCDCGSCPDGSFCDPQTATCL